MELVANPGMLFLDEPTSGLDSASSIEVCQVLKKLAHEAGLTIVAVIHQPRYEIFEMFDDVTLLGSGGRPIFIGSTDKVVSYFEGLGHVCPPLVNPADFILDVISGMYDDSKSDSTRMGYRLQQIWEEANKQAEPYGIPVENNTEMSSINNFYFKSELLSQSVVIFLLSFIFPWCLLLTLSFHWSYISPKKQFYGIFGGILNV